MRQHLEISNIYQKFKSINIAQITHMSMKFKT
jgi:hypothetical protein